MNPETFRFWDEAFRSPQKFVRWFVCCPNLDPSKISDPPSSWRGSVNRFQRKSHFQKLKPHRHILLWKKRMKVEIYRTRPVCEKGTKERTGEETKVPALILEEKKFPWFFTSFHSRFSILFFAPKISKTLKPLKCIRINYDLQHGYYRALIGLFSGENTSVKSGSADSILLRRMSLIRVEY